MMQWLNISLIHQLNSWDLRSITMNKNFHNIIFLFFFSFYINSSKAWCIRMYGKHFVLSKKNNCIKLTNVTTLVYLYGIKLRFYPRTFLCRLCFVSTYNVQYNVSQTQFLSFHHIWDVRRWNAILIMR